jgi:hypothetical protein
MYKADQFSKGTTKKSSGLSSEKNVGQAATWSIDGRTMHGCEHVKGSDFPLVRTAAEHSHDCFAHVPIVNSNCGRVTLGHPMLLWLAKATNNSLRHFFFKAMPSAWCATRSKDLCNELIPSETNMVSTLQIGYEILSNRSSFRCELLIIKNSRSTRSAVCLMNEARLLITPGTE